MFGIDLAFILGLGGFVTTLVVGAPFMRLLDEPTAWATGRRKPQASGRDRPSVTAGFVPLDLGEDPMQWPSERPWPPGLVSPPWPSETWDDEHFGRHWREEGRPAAPVSAEADLAAMRTSPPRQERSGTPARLRRSTPRPRPAPPTPSRASTPSTSRAPAPSPRTPEGPETRVTTTPPTREEIEKLIVELGLAGTVQNIMRRTGWDFRRAAHYLARVRQGQ